MQGTVQKNSRLRWELPKLAFASRRRHMWAEFVGSLLYSEMFFSGNYGFPLSTKTNMIWFIWFIVSPISTALVLS